MISPELHDVPIAALEEFGFNVRYFSILEDRMGAIYLGQLSGFTRRALLEQSNVGEGLVKDLENSIKAYKAAHGL